MTLLNAPFAVDGARTKAGLARAATYAASSGRSGVVRPLDLKVYPLDVPGNGIRIAGGNATVVNGYQSTPRESYTISNAGTHTVLSTDMPAPVPQTMYYLVCIVVGDLEFNQAGHPFMPPSLTPEQAMDFSYVRPVILPCGAGTTNFDQLGKTYPGIALARLEVPPSTATITSAMITDLRQLPTARSQRVLIPLDPPDGHAIQGAGEWIDWPPDVYATVQVPDWATHVTMTATATGVRNLGTAYGDLRVLFGGHAGPTTLYTMPNIDMLDEGTSTHMMTFEMDISQYAGTIQTLRLNGRRNPDGAPPGPLGYILTYPGTHFIFDLQFTEAVR